MTLRSTEGRSGGLTTTNVQPIPSRLTVKTTTGATQIPTVEDLKGHHVRGWGISALRGLVRKLAGAAVQDQHQDPNIVAGLKPRELLLHFSGNEEAVQVGSKDTKVISLQPDGKFTSPYFPGKRFTREQIAQAVAHHRDAVDTPGMTQTPAGEAFVHGMGNLLQQRLAGPQGVKEADAREGMPLVAISDDGPHDDFHL